MSRKYTSTAIGTTLSASLGESVSDVTMYVPNAAAATFPQAYPYTLVIDSDTTSEEIVTVTSGMDGTLTVVRGEDGTERQGHDAGASVRHMMTPRDLREPQEHISASTGVHNVSGSVVGTSGEQALTQKTISGATNTFLAIPQTAVTNLVSDLASKATNTALATSDAALVTHEADTTAIHGIADTSKLARVASASAGRTIFVQSAQPTANAVGDIWFQVTGL
jgi:hypothetical protein